MAGMFSSLFAKKMKKNNKAISRRLELLGLEERITPATISVNGNNEVVIQLNGETITDLSTSINGNLITINTAGSANNTGLGVGLTVNNNSVVVDTAVLTSFAGIQVTESNGCGPEHGTGWCEPGLLHQSIIWWDQSNFQCKRCDQGEGYRVGKFESIQ
jgi:hypothetical protein